MNSTALPGMISQAALAATDEQKKEWFGDELGVIKTAAKRNDVDTDSNWFSLLLAIRKAENGKKGREFGILHPKCDAEMKKRPKETLDIQAGWAAATIRKNIARWEKDGKKEDFITYLSRKYAPVGAKNDPDGLNKNWIKNVKYWYKKIKD